MNRGAYKKVLTEYTAWDFNVKFVNSSSTQRRKLKKRLKRLARKRINATDAY